MPDRTDPTAQPARITRAIAAAIVDQARAGKPEEICGVLRGRGLQAFEAIAVVNVAEDRINNYEVDPKALLLQFEFEEAGDEMMGIYHSHPISEAYPSATDAWNANYPDALYFICSLQHDDAPVLRAYRMTTHFLDLDLAALQGALDFYETRPGLFAYYQAADSPIPPALTDVAAAAPSPFYVVYYQQEAGQEAEARVVSIVEHPVQID